MWIIQKQFHSDQLGKNIAKVNTQKNKNFTLAKASATAIYRGEFHRMLISTKKFDDSLFCDS